MKQENIFIPEVRIPSITIEGMSEAFRVNVFWDEHKANFESILDAHEISHQSVRKEFNRSSGSARTNDRMIFEIDTMGTQATIPSDKMHHFISFFESLCPDDVQQMRAFLESNGYTPPHQEAFQIADYAHLRGAHKSASSRTRR